MSAAFELMCALRLEDGQAWGQVARPEQRLDAQEFLDGETPYHFLTRARGWSKTTDLAGLVVAAMLEQLPAASKAFSAAADQDQSRLVVDAIGGYARRTPGLADALRIDAHRVVVNRTGTNLEALAADAAGSWGLLPDVLIVDELAQWPTTPAAKQLWEALTSAAAKRPDCRIAVLTTAGDPAHWSRRILDHAYNDPMWRVHEIQGPSPWIATERIAEQQRRLPESIFQRLFNNRWTSSEDRLVTDEDLRACVVLDGPLDPQPAIRYVMGVDVGLKNDRTVVSVAHLEGTIIVLDRLAVWSGSRDRPVSLEEVEAWIAETSRRYRATVVLDPWQSAQLVERLRRRGINASEYTFTAQSVGRLASTLYLLLRERKLKLPDDEALIDELLNVRLRETSPGVLRMDHDSGRHDDRAISLALAAHKLVKRGEQRQMKSMVPRGQIGQRRKRSQVNGRVRLPVPSDRGRGYPLP